MLYYKKEKIKYHPAYCILWTFVRIIWKSNLKPTKVKKQTNNYPNLGYAVRQTQKRYKTDSHAENARKANWQIEIDENFEIQSFP